MNMLINILKWYKEYFLISFKFLKTQVVLTIIILIISCIVGYYDIFSASESVAGIFQKMIENFNFEERTPLFVNIFFQNAQATLIIICSGILFAIFPVLATILNGMIIGHLFGSLDQMSNFTKLEGILYMVPHGIFEIPAVILSISLGMKIGLWPYNKNKANFIKHSIIRSVQCYILIVIPLLIIAGLIEANNIVYFRN